MRHFSLVGAALVPLWASAGSPHIGYAQATGYYQKDTHPALYQPLNLLDGREQTAWCTVGADASKDHLQLGFRAPVTIDEIRISTGNGADDASFQKFSRAKRLSLKTADAARTFTVADQRGPQAVTLSPPLTSATYTMEIVEAYPAEDAESPVCLSDVIFYSEGKALNGSWLAPKLKFDRGRALYLGTWYAGYEGAPERFLSFFFDGTYQLVYEPVDGSKKPNRFGGPYEASAGRVSLEIPGRGKQKARLATASDAKRELTFHGAEIPEELKEPFRDAP